ncbi:MAG: hypothetical protein ACJ0PW_04945 [Flavobacteriaceae bacterium]
MIFFIPIVFAHPKNFIEEQKKLGILTNVCSLTNLKKPNDGHLNIVSTWDKPFSISHGIESSKAGSFAISSLKAATLALKKRFSGCSCNSTNSQKKYSIKRF